MAGIDLRPGSDAEQVMDTLRETLTVRGYHWEHTDSGRAVATEGGRPLGTVEAGFADRLRVGIVVGDGRLKLAQQTNGGAMTGMSGSPWLTIKLGRRFGKLVKDVRADLEAAGLA